MDYKICGECVSKIRLTNSDDPAYKMVWKVKNGKWYLYGVDETEPRAAKDFWYYWVWTLAPNHKIEEVRANIEKFANRNLGIYYMDISLEHGDTNGREHYNMRIKSRQCIKGQRVKPYERTGKINRQTIRKHTEENWDSVGNYCSKENDIEILIN